MARGIWPAVWTELIGGAGCCRWKPPVAKLVEATGHRLRVEAVEVPDAVWGLPATVLGRRLRRCRKAVIDAAARRGVRNVRVFGSAARRTDKPPLVSEILAAAIPVVMRDRERLEDIVAVAVDHNLSPLLIAVGRLLAELADPPA